MVFTNNRANVVRLLFEHGADPSAATTDKDAAALCRAPITGDAMGSNHCCSVPAPHQFTDARGSNHCCSVSTVIEHLILIHI